MTPTVTATSLQAVLRAASGRLDAAGVASPEHDARALAVHVLGLAKPSDLLLVDRLDPTQAGAYEALLGRRVAREPLQHLTGSVGFRYLELSVGPGVFVPRPETESVVQFALDALAARPGPAPLCVDLCAGSGTIALALANELPGATVHAVECDEAAMVWTRRNAALRVVAGDPSVTLHLADVQGCLPELDGTVDLVISNPPYVPTVEAHRSEPEVLEHDPGLALWGGPDGLAVIRLVEQAARRLLRPGGLVVVEHSDGQGLSAPAVFAAAGGWSEIADHQDYTGRDRYVTARRDPAVPATTTSTPATGSAA